MSLHEIIFRRFWQNGNHHKQLAICNRHSVKKIIYNHFRNLNSIYTWDRIRRPALCVHAMCVLQGFVSVLCTCKVFVISLCFCALYMPGVCYKSLFLCSVHARCLLQVCLSVFQVVWRCAFGRCVLQHLGWLPSDDSSNPRTRPRGLPHPSKLPLDHSSTVSIFDAIFLLTHIWIV